MTHQPLDDLELQALEDFLESDQVHEECHNFVMAHGFLTALSICPIEMNETKWQEILFEAPPAFSNEKEAQRIKKLLSRLKVDIQKELESEDEFLMPCEIELADSEDELSELQEWASGFMEGVFLTETHWFDSQQEEVIAELLIPFMLASDLFDDDEIANIRQTPKLAQSCIDQIPEVLTDLYLVMRTEAEQKPAKQKASANKKVKR